jgi:sugar phosphate isomerase/epimerase
MNAQIAMNTVTIKPTPLLDKLRLISQVGFSGIGLWMDEIQEYLNGGGGKPIGELLAEYGLTPVEM